ncbi:glutathione peroxidase [Saprolegnia diclina VS20]|uniref:Glutathione peroxidase n=1 Tax=Saprolegnia diclina (strain VS20) TaxID=1156394 RepID=T0QKZ5_SAPDV|nr:glutathione peroxidase [Saprolegnia diclina VS20]EQC35386.1 glutathione peroxidase [Saprolegnia diclina VS20]|eukprot:XP_008611136.1 glutathione peroxidase [Saprolegnia diclina VS20]
MHLAAVAWACVAWLAAATMAAPTSFFDFVVKGVDGADVPLSRYAGSKAILVVNVASACGLTDSNYRELQALYTKYHDQGLEILGFPCNQFGAQEPGTMRDILAFTHGYDVTFPIFQKVDVNGQDADPVFAYLTSVLAGSITNDVKWNFSKFLLAHGRPYARYAPTTSPAAIEDAIVRILSSQSHDEL